MTQDLQDEIIEICVKQIIIDALTGLMHPFQEAKVRADSLWDQYKQGNNLYHPTSQKVMGHVFDVRSILVGLEKHGFEIVRKSERLDAPETLIDS